MTRSVPLKMDIVHRVRACEFVTGTEYSVYLDWIRYHEEARADYAKYLQAEHERQQEEEAWEARLAEQEDEWPDHPVV